MTTRIKILDIINTAASARQLLLNRVRAVNERDGFENWVACGDGPDLWDLRAAAIPVEVIESPPGISLSHVSPLATAVALRRMTRFIREQRFSAVHTHGPVQGVIGRVAAHLARTPVVIHTEHGAVYHEHQNPVARRAYMLAERLMSSVTDHLLFLTEAERRHAVEAGLSGRATVHLIGNGIDLAGFSESRSRGAVHRHAPVVIAVARLDPVKNIPMLLRAVKRLVRQGVAFECWILGDGVCRRELLHYVQKHDLEGHVRFLGYRTDVADVIREADVAVLTSIKEGVPRGLMEPLAMGLPAVATDVKGNREVIRDGKCGYLVPLDDDAALAERLGRLLRDPSLRARMGAAGARRVRERFDERDVINRILALYSELFPQTETQPELTRAWAAN